MKLLHIESSIFADAGVSSQLSRQLIESLRQSNPSLDIIEKHFAKQPMPHFDGVMLQAVSTAPELRTAEQAQLAKFADKQIEELQQADILVIGMPMYNFGVPSMLKSWFDFVARAGVTFQYTEHGPEGLLQGKKAYVIATRGGQYKDTPMDSQTPFVETFLKFLGIIDIKFIYAEALNMGDESRQLSIDQAQQKIQSLAA